MVPDDMLGIQDWHMAKRVYKCGPRALIELPSAAFNAYLSGKRATNCEHEWMGVMIAYIAKQRSALHVTEFRPIARYAKFAIFNRWVQTTKCINFVQSFA
jgi:hypothetical protein